MASPNVVRLRRVAPWWSVPSQGAIVIDGGRRLAGTLAIAGAKNAALPLMIASILSERPLVLRNLPRILDVAVLANILEGIGVSVEWDERGDTLTGRFCGRRLGSGAIDGVLVTRMRASFLVAGAMLARLGRVALPLPGGDAIGLRPVDFHLAGFRAMGATVSLDAGGVTIAAPRGLRGARIVLPSPSVGATENLMLAATLARGETAIVNAAREPEVGDLARCLVAMGAQIDGVGTDVLRITGVAALDAANHVVLADRIELGTFMCAAAITDGDLTLTGADPALLAAAGPAFAAAGIAATGTGDGVRVRRASGGLRGIDVVTQPFPGFATDLQAQAMALLCRAEGAGVITETLFESRFRHVPELQRMGANIRVVGRNAMIRGVPALHGTAVEAGDVRAGAALAIAGFSAAGTTTIAGVEHFDRGYDRFVERLARCGAAIRRVAG
ncbi:MAG: UDP-N-acetylglucosamine 1-carboxyvinyltransferase [Alphaproteobacteria bacterium]|nr:UDP-N-acetylglucosamine 1-carboxyvinyltransferase [Alphaproteobacteria bacterium]